MDARLELAWRAPSCRYVIDQVSDPEDIVLILLIYLLPLLRKALDRAEHSRRDAYLASAADMGELERRMHSMEIDR
ncbi:DUF3563 family protein [Caballeronia sp. LjRoot29]|uniref:DUF3563 family protein n=1 Tax=Caballeronia sp. LjRoot29 TaxID=3342315 RepID=UPI003ECEEA8F